jgi:hypothetical protein
MICCSHSMLNMIIQLAPEYKNRAHREWSDRAAAWLIENGENPLETLSTTVPSLSAFYSDGMVKVADTSATVRLSLSVPERPLKRVRQDSPILLPSHGRLTLGSLPVYP